MDRRGLAQSINECDWNTDPLQTTMCWKDMHNHLHHSGISLEEMDIKFQTLYAKFRESFAQCGADHRKERLRRVKQLDTNEAMMLLCYGANHLEIQQCTPGTWLQFMTDFSRISGVQREDLPAVEQGQWCVKYLRTPKACIRLALRHGDDDQCMATCHTRVTSNPKTLLDDRSDAFYDALCIQLELDALKPLLKL